ncbi:MAG: DUF4229 domain-containing protein [Actinomycetes bacterium]
MSEAMPEPVESEAPAVPVASYRAVVHDPRLAPLWYTLARLGLLIVAAGICYALGARGWLLLALAFVISGIAAVPLLSKQRGSISAGIVSIADRLNKKIDDAAASEDDE